MRRCAISLSGEPKLLDSRWQKDSSCQFCFTPVCLWRSQYLSYQCFIVIISRNGAFFFVCNPATYCSYYCRTTWQLTNNKLFGCRVPTSSLYPASQLPRIEKSHLLASLVSASLRYCALKRPVLLSKTSTLWCHKGHWYPTDVTTHGNDHTPAKWNRNTANNSRKLKLISCKLLRKKDESVWKSALSDVTMGSDTSPSYFGDNNPSHYSFHPQRPPCFCETEHQF